LDIFAAFATDEAAEEDGVVHFLLAGKTDLEVDPWIRVARLGNTAYSKKVSEVYARLNAEKEAEGLSEAEVEIRSKNAMTEVFAETLLKGFGNLQFQKQAITPTPEWKLTLMRVKDFRERVVELAAKVEHYRLKGQQAAAGN
jgi:hypothetical protein